MSPTETRSGDSAQSEPSGGARASFPTVLLLIDVINDCEFPEADALLAQARPASHRIDALRNRAASLGVPVVYVNDNFGRWRSERSQIVEACTREGARGREISLRLVPREDDYFVVKPMHSGFYSTILEVLLRHLGARRLVLAGIASDLCVLFTANDAYMRGFQLWVPADCVAANSGERSRYALAHMHQNLKAEIRPTSELDLGAWSRRDAGAPEARVALRA